MQETVTLKITIEYTGNLKAAIEELNKAVQKCNCMSSSIREEESFSYRAISSEVDYGDV